MSQIPWSLAQPDGGLVKTVKSKLLDAIESSVVGICDELPKDSCMIFDGMVLLKQLGCVQLSTFGDISEYVLKRITSDCYSWIYFVTDQYKAGSIKSFERNRRGLGGFSRIRIDRREQRTPKQWVKFMRNGENKTDLVKFLLKDWSHEICFLHLLNGKKV